VRHEHPHDPTTPVTHPAWRASSCLRGGRAAVPGAGTSVLVVALGNGVRIEGLRREIRDRAGPDWTSEYSLTYAARVDLIDEPAQLRPATDAGRAAAPRTARARPLSRQDRREAIALATIPLLEQHGAQVSTRQIALAAGVAEGTLFRAFDDKIELLMTAAERMVDPTRTVAAIEALPDAGSLEGEVVQVAEHLAGMARRFRRVMLAVHGVLVSEEGQRAAAVRRARAAAPDEGGHGRFRRGHADQARSMQAVRAAGAARLAPYAEGLRVDPETAVQLLSAMIMGQGPPGLPEDAEVATASLVDVLLHGVAR
jgi:AcrR family transcriptional regulator